MPWVQCGDGRSQLRMAAVQGEEGAGEDEEIAGRRARPANRTRGRAAVERERAEVEVGEMDDREPVQFLRQPFQRDLDLDQLEPLGLEERPAESRRGG